MPAIRRNNHSPRFEMLPLIDVVFLLLTFFIYAIVMRVQVDAFTLMPIGSGEGVVPAEHRTVTLDIEGRYVLDGNRISEAELQRTFETMARTEADPTVFVLTEVAGPEGQPPRLDRVPALMDLVQMGMEAGVNVRITGPRREDGARPADDDP